MLEAIAVAQGPGLWGQMVEQFYCIAAARQLTGPSALPGSTLQCIC